MKYKDNDLKIILALTIIGRKMVAGAIFFRRNVKKVLVLLHTLDNINKNII